MDPERDRKYLNSTGREKRKEMRQYLERNREVKKVLGLNQKKVLNKDCEGTSKVPQKLTKYFDQQGP